MAVSVDSVYIGLGVSSKDVTSGAALVTVLDTELVVVPPYPSSAVMVHTMRSPT